MRGCRDNHREFVFSSLLLSQLPAAWFSISGAPAYTRVRTVSHAFSARVLHLVLQNAPNFGAPARSLAVNGLVRTRKLRTQIKGPPKAGECRHVDNDPSAGGAVFRLFGPTHFNYARGDDKPPQFRFWVRVDSGGCFIEGVLQYKYTSYSVAQFSGHAGHERSPA